VPGAQVSVRIEDQCVADSTGKWKIMLAPLSADKLTALGK
jgi:hypothetical protein